MEQDFKSTQAAADYLMISRLSLLKLLDDGVIPHYKVGVHQRTLLKDLIKYRKKKNKGCRKAKRLLRSEADLISNFETPT